MKSYTLIKDVSYFLLLRETLKAITQSLNVMLIFYPTLYSDSNKFIQWIKWEQNYDMSGESIFVFSNKEIFE